MPLKKSPTPAAFKANIKAEVKAGKPVKQAVAIAYSVKKKAQKYWLTTPALTKLARLPMLVGATTTTKICSPPCVRA